MMVSTGKWNNDWSWRVPLFIQIVPATLNVLFVFLAPESYAPILACLYFPSNAPRSYTGPAGSIPKAEETKHVEYLPNYTLPLGTFTLRLSNFRSKRSKRRWLSMVLTVSLKFPSFPRMQGPPLLHLHRAVSVSEGGHVPDSLMVPILLHSSTQVEGCLLTTCRVIVCREILGLPRSVQEDSWDSIPDVHGYPYWRLWTAQWQRGETNTTKSTCSGHSLCFPSY